MGSLGNLLVNGFLRKFIGKSVYYEILSINWEVLLVNVFIGKFYRKMGLLANFIGK